MNGLLLALFLAVPAAAQQYVPASFRDFTGGVNNNAPGIALPPNESPNAVNVVIDEPPGSLKSRTGFTQCGTLPSGNTPTALYEYSKSDGSRRLIVTDNANYYSTADCVTFTTIKTGLSSTAQPTFTIARDNLWITNRSTWVATWDGSTYTLLDGTANTPNPAPPRCAYLEFWKERVWCANSASNPSGVAFSALTDSLGNAITPSTGSAAWPAANLIQVNQNGGSQIFGLKAFKNGLFVLMNNGIWEIQFENEFSIFVRKTLSSVGSRFHQASAEVDGLLHFVGPDGIYAFDGDMSVRISDKILPIFDSLNQPLVNNQYKSWTSASDFNGGTLVQTSSATTLGSVVLATNTALGIDNPGFETGSTASWASSYTSTNSIFASTTTQPIIKGTYSGVLAACSNGVFAHSEKWYITDSNDNQLLAGNIVINGDGVTITTTTIDATSVSSQTLKLKLSVYGGYGWNTLCGGDGDTMSMISTTFTTTGIITFNSLYFDANTSLSYYALPYRSGLRRVDNFITSGYYSTGTWTSDIFNAVTVSSWSTMDATYVKNGGDMSFYVRVGSNTGAVNARNFVLMTPGSIINGTTDQIYVQVRASFTANANNTATPRMDDITVNYAQGGSTAQTIFAAGWKNRLWITASSGTSTTNNIVLVKSKHPSIAWVPYSMSVTAFARYNDKFYAGASTHSAIYRLDSGTSDNGAIIPALWETRDETWNLPTNPKALMEVYADYEQGAANSMIVGYSRNNGTAYTDKSFSIAGAGRSGKRLLMNGGNSIQYRFRVLNQTKDEAFKFYGLDAYALPYNVRGP